MLLAEAELNAAAAGVVLESDDDDTSVLCAAVVEPDVTVAAVAADVLEQTTNWQASGPYTESELKPCRGHCRVQTGTDNIPLHTAVTAHSSDGTRQ